jgi:hypothetical protein
VAVVKIQADGVPTELAYRVCNVVNDTTGHVMFDPVIQTFEVDGDENQEFAIRNFELLVKEIPKIGSLADEESRRVADFRWGKYCAEAFIDSVKKTFGPGDWIVYGNHCLTVDAKKSVITAVMQMVDAFDAGMEFGKSDNKEQSFLRILKSGITRHRDILPRMGMRASEFAKLVRRMIRDQKIETSKEGRGVVYAIAEVAS